MGSRDKKQKQIIRVIYSDPDATDSSDDERDPKRCFVRMDVGGVSRMVREVCIGNDGDDNVCSSSKIKSSTSKGKCKAMMDRPKNTDGSVKAAKSGRSSAIYPGVRRRPRGKYATEIRNPLRGNKREWIGTFDTAEQARDAHQKRKHEIDVLVALEKEKNTSSLPAVVISAVTAPAVVTSVVCAVAEPSTSEDNNANTLSDQASPSSVLDIPVGNGITVVIKSEDNQNPEMNEYRPPDTGTLLEFPGLDLTGCSFFDLDFDSNFDELRVEDLPMCDLTQVGLSDLPNIDFDITMADFNIADDLLDFTKGSGLYI